LHRQQQLGPAGVGATVLAVLAQHLGRFAEGGRLMDAERGQQRRHAYLSSRGGTTRDVIALGSCDLSAVRVLAALGMTVMRIVLAEWPPGSADSPCSGRCCRPCRRGSP